MTRIYHFLIRCDKTDGYKKRIITTGSVLQFILYLIFLVVSGIIKSAHNYVFAVREFYLRKRVNE